MPVLMTWNVRYFSEPTAGLRSTEEGVQGVADGVAKVAPDLLLLQEVEQDSLRAGATGKPQIERLSEALSARGLAYQVLYYPAHRYKIGPVTLYSAGLATLVRAGVPILTHNADAPADITHRRFQRLARWKQTRIAAHVKVSLPGGTLDVINTHLSLPAFLTPELLRIRERMGEEDNQIREIAAVLQTLPTVADHAVVVAGDLNSRPGSAVLQSLARAGLRDPFVEHVPPERYDRWTTQILGRNQLHLDHVWVSPRVSVGGIGLSHPCGEGPFDGLSDHLPKIIELTPG